MAISRDILVLARSFKNHGYCVAGKELETGAWIRPVSTPEGGSLSKETIQIRNPYGRFMLKPLQIVDVPLARPVPSAVQPENHLVGAGEWRQKYGKNREVLAALCDDPGHLWDHDASCHRVAPEALPAGEGHGSLYLIHVDAIHCIVKHGYHGQKKIVAHFIYRGRRYGLTLTDPAYEKFLHYDVGYEWEEQDRYLCLSLTEAFYGYCYKLVAAVL